MTKTDEERRAEVAGARLVAAAQNHALTRCGEEARSLRKQQQRYEDVILHAAEIGCGASAIGRAVGLSEGAVRGFLRRRRSAA